MAYTSELELTVKIKFTVQGRRNGYTIKDFEKRIKAQKRKVSVLDVTVDKIDTKKIDYKGQKQYSKTVTHRSIIQNSLPTDLFFYKFNQSYNLPNVPHTMFTIHHRAKKTFPPIAICGIIGQIVIVYIQPETVSPDGTRTISHIPLPRSGTAKHVGAIVWEIGQNYRGEKTEYKFHKIMLDDPTSFEDLKRLLDTIPREKK